SKAAIQDWIYFDKDNKIIYDQEKIAEYLKRYNDKYSSYVNPRQFRSTNQGIVTVQPGTLGWSIDRAAEAEQIAVDLAAGKDVERVPIVVGSGYGSAGDGIGSTYVEVDLS
ncbi:peptidoglycan binding domain-containing protein, partial [Escherichia coli]